MRDERGVTLIELMVVVALLGLLATGAYALSRAAFRNSSLGATTFELSTRLLGLKAAALAEQKDHLFVVLDATDAAACSWAVPAKCARWFVLRNPDAAFTLAGFQPSSPSAHAELVDSDYLPTGIKLHPAAGGAPPPPFATVPFFSSELTGTGPRRFAIRFVRDGTVTGEKAGAATGPWPGYAFALTTTQLGETAAADRKGVVVSFPAGIVRTFPVQ